MFETIERLEQRRQIARLFRHLNRLRQKQPGGVRHMRIHHLADFVARLAVAQAARDQPGGQRRQGNELQQTPAQRGRRALEQIAAARHQSTSPS